MMPGILFFYEGVVPFLTRDAPIANCLREVAKQEGDHIQWLHVIFCSAAHLYHLNVKHLQHHTHTDILTFDHSDEHGLAGELFLSLPTIQENAKDYEAPLANELWRVMSHGLLHLLGYADDSDKAKKSMQAKEEMYIKKHLSVITQCSTWNIA